MLAGCPTLACHSERSAASRREQGPYPASSLATQNNNLIDEVVTRLWNFKDHRIENFEGPYAEWKDRHN
jgi:hypothetical protein